VFRLKVFLHLPAGIFACVAFLPSALSVAGRAPCIVCGSAVAAFTSVALLVVAPASIDLFIGAAAFLACWRSLAAASRFSSLVSKAGHSFSWKSRRACPSAEVVDSKIPKLRSVCCWSFARPCQCAKMNRRFKRRELCGSGRRPSKTGMEHYEHYVNISPCFWYILRLTCRRFSKSLAPSFFNSEILLEKRRIESQPNVGVTRKLPHLFRWPILKWRRVLTRNRGYRLLWQQYPRSEEDRGKGPAKLPTRLHA